MSQKSFNFKESCQNYLDFFCQNTSCHGGNWAMKAKSPKLKITLQIILMLIQILMLAVVIRIFFFRVVQPTFYLDYIPNNGTFPNVTICNHRMFDLAKSQGL